MGCGPSKENTVTVRNASFEKEPVHCDNTTEASTVGIKVDPVESVASPPSEQENEAKPSSPRSPESVAESESVTLSSSDFEFGELETVLANAAVVDVLQSIQSSGNVEKTAGDGHRKNADTQQLKTLTPIAEQDEISIPQDRSSSQYTILAESTQAMEHSTPVPSAQPPTPLPEPESKIFDHQLKKSCRITSGGKLLELASNGDNLKLDRSFYCFSNSNLLSEIVGVMTKLRVLDLRGGQCGPVVFRIILNALMNDNRIKELNLSDNLANPECSELLGKLLLNNSHLEILDVSGNQLGKDALSRYLGNSLRENHSLKYLNISGCGATDLHSLCESLRNSTCSVLTTLIASHNNMTDGHQFGVDISLVLECSPACKLKMLDITNTSITPSGLSAISTSIVKNSSLESLLLGQNTAKGITQICEMILSCCENPNLKELNLNKTTLEDRTEVFNVDTFAGKTLENTTEISCLSIADCGLNDVMAQFLSSILEGKLTNMLELDLSNNNDLSIESFSLFDKLCGGKLHCLKAALFEQISGLQSVLLSTCTGLVSLDLTRSRLQPNDIKEICQSCPQKITFIKLDGIKLSGTAVVSSISSANFTSVLSSLHLSGCQLIDEDVVMLSAALKATSSIPLKTLDISVNRLTAKTFEDIAEALLAHNSHPLEIIDASNNVMNGNCLAVLSNLLTHKTHRSNIRSVNLACNDITASHVIDFFASFKREKYTLEYFDLRNQTEAFGEDDCEALGETLNEVLFKPESLSKDFQFLINLTGLGGSDVQSLCLLDSASIRTDFVNLRKPTLSMKDVLEIAKGIGILNDIFVPESTYTVPSSIWREIIGKDAPAWAFVTSEVQKAAFFMHMPATVTVQRLQGMLEMEADCEVKDVFLVKDPIMRKPTGCAWVLFEDSKYLSAAVEWYISGYAQMYGTPFTISEIPAIISDESSEAGTSAQKDMAAREQEMKKQMEEDKKILEDSLKLAAERAEYREAHPAYQGGRIS